MTRWLLLAMLASCSNGDDCQLPDGPFINSADESTNMPTAAGGKQRFIMTTDQCVGETQVHNLLAISEDPTIATVQVIDDQIELAGLAPGRADVHVSGKEAGANTSFDVVAIDHIALSGQSDHATFVAGTAFAIIQLIASDGTMCVDRTVTVTGPLRLGTSWDRLAIGSAASGSYDETIHAGGSDWPVTITVQ